MMEQKMLQLKAPVSYIHSFSIHDGPGIRVSVFLEGCPLRCLWCSDCDLCVNYGAFVAAWHAEARENARREMTVEEVLKRILKDKMFMDTSGGGITVSGGECLMHPDFTEALLLASKEEGLHTAVESCVHADRETVDRVFKYADLALVDIKHMNPRIHRKYTGVPNWMILDNIKHISCDLRIPLMISISAVAGYNDDDHNIMETARFITEELSGDVTVRLLPYYNPGELKNINHGKVMNLPPESPPEERLQYLKGVIESFGVAVQLGI